MCLGVRTVREGCVTDILILDYPPTTIFTVIVIFLHKRGERVGKGGWRQLGTQSGFEKISVFDELVVLDIDYVSGSFSHGVGLSAVFDFLFRVSSFVRRDAARKRTSYVRSSVYLCRSGGL